MNAAQFIAQVKVADSLVLLESFSRFWPAVKATEAERAEMRMVWCQRWETISDRWALELAAKME